MLETNPNSGRNTDIVKPEVDSGEGTAEATQPTQHDTQTPKAKSHRRRNSRNYTKHVLHFCTVKGHVDIGRAVIRFRNVADKPLNFKLKCEEGCNIAAHPAGNGVVAPHSAHRCVLTWHRPRDAISWTNLKPPRLAIITNFFTGPDFSSGDKLTTKFIGNITDLQQEAGEKPPTTKLTFNIDKAPVVTPYKASSKREHGTPAIDNCTDEPMPCEDMLYYNAIIEWMQMHPTEMLLAVIITFVGAACVLSEFGG